MLYYLCEQTAAGNACAKRDETVQLLDRLTGALIGVARATEGNDHVVGDSTADVIVEGLAATLTRENYDHDALRAMTDRANAEKRRMVPDCFHCMASCGRNNDYDMRNLWDANEDIRALKSLILFGARSIAAHAHHAAVLGSKDDAIHRFLYKALFAVGMDDWGVEELLPIVLEAGEVNRKSRIMLDKVNTGPRGHSLPAEVGMTMEEKPYIVITGYGNFDLKRMLEQTAGRGINLYIHSKLLPADTAPEWKEYSHLKVYPE